jgi:hypothetical protein
MHIGVGVSGMLLRFRGVLFTSVWDDGIGFSALYSSEDLTMNCLLHFEKPLLVQRMIFAEW